MIRLKFVDTLIERYSKGCQKIQVILGPRQVGKTTGMLQFKEEVGNCNYQSADSIFSDWYNWLDQIFQDSDKDDSIIIIDEIQKIPNWSEKIKELWDNRIKQKKRCRCILLGSSSLEIQVGLTESLTGRYELLKVPHWSFADSTKLTQCSLDEYLVFGGYPGAYEFTKDFSRWREYITSSIVNNVIMKDILQFRTVKNPALFKQAFDIISHYPSHEISYNKLLGQLQSKGNIEIIKHYLQLFENAFLIKELHKYSQRPLNRKVSSPKILHRCCAFYGRLYGKKILTDANLKGHAFETIVGNILINKFENVYYWRKGNFEVDFVVEELGQLIGIEVKSGRRKRESSKDQFLKNFPEATFYWVTPENFIEYEKDVQSFLGLTSP